ncbi:MAG: ABC transporter ATP-binding protein [Calditrichaeota bacterium]|nr:ABC transporter ATP-binding protein [Calditrichota bacterium]
MLVPSKNIDADERGISRRLLRLFKPYRGLLALALVGALFVGLANSAVSLVGALMMELFSAAGAQSQTSGFALHLSRAFGGFRLYDLTLNSPSQARWFLLILTSVTIILILIKGLVHFAKEYVLWKVTNGVLMRLKSDLFARIVRLPLTYYDRERSGEVVARITYDVTQMEGAIRAGVQISKSFVYAAIYIAMMFLLEWSLTLLALAIFPLSAIVIKQFSARMRRAARHISQNVADYTAFLNEATTGARVIKAFGEEQRQTTIFDHKIAENYRWSMKAAKYAALHAPIQEAISTVGTAALLVFCGLRILSGAITLGDLTGFILLLTNTYKPIKDIGEVNSVLQRAVASGKRIFQITDEADEAEVIGSGSLRPAVEGRLEFDRVSFAYRDGEPALSSICLTVEAGQTLALVGPSGAGKSTLAALIPRFYRLKDGSIKLDGIDISEFDLTYLRSLIAYVPQETILFSGSIADNIRFGRPEASETEVIAAAQAANAAEFIEKLPEGYHSEVGERGAQLSGGQRQRIAIARAMLRDPKILLLDEATSALDTASEKLVQEALERLRCNRTTIIIAHRLSTVRSADLIAVLSEGCLIETGTHRELFEAQGLYRQLCDQQLTE